VCLYYAINGPPPVTDPILILNGNNLLPSDSPLYSDSMAGGDAVKGGGQASQAITINNVCFPSSVSSDYAPAGKSLASITVVGISPDTSIEALETAVTQQLQAWWPEVEISTNWKLLKVYR